MSELRSLLIAEESDISKANTIMNAQMLVAMVAKGLSFSTSSTTEPVLNSSNKTSSSVNSNLSEYMLGSSSQPPYSQGNSYDTSWFRGGYTGGRFNRGKGNYKNKYNGGGRYNEGYGRSQYSGPNSTSFPAGGPQLSNGGQSFHPCNFQNPNGGYNGGQFPSFQYGGLQFYNG
ncbi:hypothetical protein ACFX14_040829 [Malus domestica]